MKCSGRAFIPGMGILSSLPVLGNWRVGMGEDAFLRALLPRELSCLEAHQRPSHSVSGPRVCVPPAPHLGTSHQKPLWFCSMPGLVCKGKGSSCVFQGQSFCLLGVTSAFPGACTPSSAQGRAFSIPVLVPQSPCDRHRALTAPFRGHTNSMSTTRKEEHLCVLIQCFSVKPAGQRFWC